MKDILTLNGKVFNLVSTQRSGDTGIYRCEDEYLRIGNRERIMRDLNLHKLMMGYGFPLAEIIQEGEYEEDYYFIELSLGNQDFSQIFMEDTKKQARISDQNFAEFIAISKRFAAAQLNSRTETRKFDEFARGIHLETLMEEFPEEADKIKSYFERVKNRISALPFVITHGDFNPRNLYPKGAIDLEDSFMGPAGYDLVTNIIHIRYFPESAEYEYYAHYRISEEQKQQYLANMDAVYLEHNLPKLSDYFDDLGFCRAVWHTVRMHQWPKIQKFRYDLFKKDYIKQLS